MNQGTRAAALAFVAVLLSASAAAAATGPTMDVLSTRADLIAGGGAVVEVRPPSGVDAAKLKVAVDGRDVTSRFGVRPGGRFIGLLEGLRNGRNVMAARAPDGTQAQIAIVNHAIGGPVTSGPQIQPWKCAAGTSGPQCDRDVTYAFSYKSTGGGPLRSYDTKNPPSDVATTTTDQGRTVPFIVRQET